MLQQIPLMGRGRYLESMDGWVNRMKYYLLLYYHLLRIPSQQMLW